MRINFGNGNELTSNDDLHVQQFVTKIWGYSWGIMPAENTGLLNWMLWHV